MEKIVMYLKKVIILLCGIVLGYLTSRRTDMSISLECILGDGVFIVLVITIIMVITKTSQLQSIPKRQKIDIFLLGFET